MSEYREDPPEVRAEFERKALAEALAEIEQRGGMLAEAERADWARRMDQAFVDGLAVADADAVRDKLDDLAARLPPRKRGQKVKEDLEAIERLARVMFDDPGLKKQYLLAEASGLTESDVSKFLRGRRLGRKLGEIYEYQRERHEAEKENAARDLNQRVEQIAHERLPRWIAERWPGAVRSMHDRAIYTTAEAYTAHLLEAVDPENPDSPVLLLPADLMNEVRAELERAGSEIRLIQAK